MPRHAPAPGNRWSTLGSEPEGFLLVKAPGIHRAPTPLSESEQTGVHKGERGGTADRRADTTGRSEAARCFPKLTQPI